MTRPKLPREKSWILPDVRNPFVHSLHLSTLDKVQIVLMSIFVVPLRFLLLFISLTLSWALACVALWGRSREEMKEPLSGWRKHLGVPIKAFGRLAFFFASFHRIRIKGQQADVPVLVCAPHCSFFDISAMFAFKGIPSGVSRAENGSIPIVGTLTHYTQPVFVSREDKNSRENTIKEIKHRAQSGGKWPQVIIFPEGTCTNTSCLITYKPGGFYPGVPVQPVVLKYWNKMDTCIWTWDGPGAFTCLWLTLCQFYSTLEIEFLPVYYPSEEEKENAFLFGKNVRAIMAKALDVPVTDHTFEDCRLMAYAEKLNMPAAMGLVEFNKINKKLGMNFDNLKALFEKFCKISQEGKGNVTIEEFAQYLDLPVSDTLQEMFDIYDRDGSGSIDFREFVIGLHLVSGPANSDDTIQLAFQLFDKGGKGYITEPELQEILNDAFNMSEVDVHKLFSQVNKATNGKITYDEFKNYAQEKPEYAKLFQTYQAMQKYPGPIRAQHCSVESQGGAATQNNVNSKVKAE